ncbi:MAG: sulfurtransferase-like selenium metabolism protein YedF [Desulfovibrionales bacterium]
MSEIKVECQGLPCPQPVLKSKQVIQAHHPETLVVVVDNQASMENVKRFLSTQKYSIIATEEHGGEWNIRATKQEATSPQEQPEPSLPHKSGGPAKTLVFIASDRIGAGDDELGAKLMKNFLSTLPEMEGLWRIIFVNSGVNLCVAGSAVLESLLRLEQDKVSILVCGTCLDHFGILEKKSVGQTTNMLDVITSMQIADKVVSV